MILLNDNTVTFGCFPNGEINLPIVGLPLIQNSIVKLVYDDDYDFFRLALLKSWLDDMNCRSCLYIAYMPYSRMDRSNGHYAISIKAACTLLNAMRFEQVIVREPHSQITMDLLKNAESDPWCRDRICKVIAIGNYDSLFFPDYGAITRYQGVTSLPTAYGTKNRDFLSGKIDSLELKGTVGRTVLIVDDLCSRGGTFVSGAKLLMAKGASSIDLLVAYVEDNVFTGELFDYVDRIYTSTERMLRNHPRITKLL